VPKFGSGIQLAQQATPASPPSGWTALYSKSDGLLYAQSPAGAERLVESRTGSVMLPVGAAVLPDGSASNLAPGIVRVKSSGAAPGVYFLQANFDAAQLEWLCWTFRMPSNYASTPVLKIQYKMTSATTGNVIVIGRVAAITPGDATDMDAKVFAAANTSAASAVPATTAGKVGEISLSLSTNDSLAAGDLACVYFGRDGANGSDTAAGDMECVAFTLEYAA
jgi:hypothetical protein